MLASDAHVGAVQDGEIQDSCISKKLAFTVAPMRAWSSSEVHEKQDLLIIVYHSGAGPPLLVYNS